MMNVKIKVYDRVKYDKESKKIAEAHYEIESYEIVNGDQIDIESFGNDVDERDEYLVLRLADGDTSTFRNSYVDMFRED